MLGPSISLLYGKHIETFREPDIVYLHSKCLQQFINLTSVIFKLNTFKHVQNLTFASCLLNT